MHRVLLLNDELGQCTYRFLMRFTKDESEINLATGEADPEFAEWKWASPEEVIEQVRQKFFPSCKLISSLRYRNAKICEITDSRQWTTRGQRMRKL